MVISRWDFNFLLFQFEVSSTVFYQVWCALFYIENDAEIFPAHYTWKVAEKGFKMDFMINSCEIILEK